MQEHHYGPIFFVIQRPGGAAFFCVRRGSWFHHMENVANFGTRERANASALEWSLEGIAVVVPYRTVRNERPQRCSHDDEQSHGERPF